MADAWSFLFSFFSFLFLNKKEERKTDSGRLSLQSPHGYFSFFHSHFSFPNLCTATPTPIILHPAIFLRKKSCVATSHSSRALQIELEWNLSWHLKPLHYGRPSPSSANTSATQQPRHSTKHAWRSKNLVRRLTPIRPLMKTRPLMKS